MKGFVYDLKGRRCRFTFARVCTFVIGKEKSEVNGYSRGERAIDGEAESFIFSDALLIGVRGEGYR